MSLNSGAAFSAGIFNEYQRPLDARTRELLLESAPLSQQWSEQECTRKPKGGMEEWSQDNHPDDADNCDCAWYHGTWQYLRLLGMVAVPDWHRSFYTEALWNILRRKPDANVLISAAADYGMLAMLHEAMELTASSPRVVIYDNCKTPLLSCQWYAERHGISIETKCDNIITSPIPEAPFDLILTDEFFTVLKAEDKPLFSKRWKELLKPGGSVVTAVMMGNATTPDLRRHYAERARQLLEASNGNFSSSRTKHRTEAIVDRFVAFAELHTRHMVTSESEVHSLFSGFDSVTCRRITTPGECVNPTDSFQVVASLAPASFAVGIFKKYERLLDARTRELLLESAPLSQQWSEQECTRKPKGGMEEWSQDNLPDNADNCDCAWYHGTWQYLRLLGMVAVPDWHRSFYTEALGNILRRKPDANVLISAAADYGMLAMLHEAMKLTGSSPRVVIYDICKTPLLSSQWYAERHGISIETKCDNIITSPIPEAPFDLIVTDEFFTVLKAEYKPLISKRWKELLKPGGSVVTAVMMGNATTPDLRRHYAERARQLSKVSNGKYLPGQPEHCTEAVIDRCVAFAELHTRHMVTSESEVYSLLSCFDGVTCRRITTPGECVNPTDSFQIVASLAERTVGAMPMPIDCLTVG